MSPSEGCCLCCCEQLHGSISCQCLQLAVCLQRVPTYLGLMIRSAVMSGLHCEHQCGATSATRSSWVGTGAGNPAARICQQQQSRARLCRLAWSCSIHAARLHVCRSRQQCSVVCEAYMPGVAELLAAPVVASSNPAAPVVSALAWCEYCSAQRPIPIPPSLAQLHTTLVQQQELTLHIVIMSECGMGAILKCGVGTAAGGMPCM